MALPTTGLTAHYDASEASDLFTTFVSGGPHTGTPVDGSSVAVWDHEAGADRIFKQSGASALPVWRATTPLLPLPCLDFTGGQRLILTNNANSNRPLSEIITASAFTLLVAFWAETITTANATAYNGEPLVADTGAYWGAYLHLVASVPKVSAYTWDTSYHAVSLTVTPGARHVLAMRLASGTLYAALDGGAESSVAVTHTGSVAGNIVLGAGIGGAGNLDGRLGEIAIYNVALAGADLTDAVSYFTTKWITGAPAAVARGETFVLLPV